MSSPATSLSITSLVDPTSAVLADEAGEDLVDGMALCLSGGGYRAMLFHLGALWRLNEIGLLGGLRRISSVSGGSITAGVLGVGWRRLGFDAASTAPAAAWKDIVVDPIRALARTTIDAGAVVKGVLLPGSVSDRVVGALGEQLFGDATLQDLPADDEGPRFVINASNMQSGALWRFSRPYMWDYRVGKVEAPTVPLAVAVAASAAFPPFLSPLELPLDPASFAPNTGQDLQREPYTSKVVLTDGGVYDNLGLETCWKRYRTILVSDAGGAVAPEPTPKRNWPAHAYRVLELIDGQVRALRKRQVIEAFKTGARDGAYWGIRTNVADYGLADPLPVTFDRTIALANTPTRLKALPDELQEALVNWGYAVADTAIRRHVRDDVPPPRFPYEGGVGGP